MTTNSTVNPPGQGIGPHHAVSFDLMNTIGRPVRRRDRRGRGLRGPLAWPAVPAMRSRSDVFDDAVLDALEQIERRLGGQVENLEIAVELVPPSDPNPWEEQRVPLSRLFPPEPGLPGKIVLYRRPVETSLEHADDLPWVVHQLLVDQLAVALDMDPLELDPHRWDY